MKQHQISIQAATQNTRLPTDAEIQSASSAAASRLSAIKSIDIKIVFPDQSSVLAPFTNTDTTQDLYTYVRGLLARPDQGFGLSYAGAKGMVLLDEAAGKMLIPDLRFTGNTLIRVMWGDAVGIDIRHSPSLKDDVRKEAMEFVVRSFDDTDADKDERGSSGTAPEVKEDKKSGSGSSGKLPKWLKLPGKK